MNAAVSPMPLPPSILREFADETGFIVYRKADKCPIHPDKLYAIDAQDSANWLAGKMAALRASILGPDYGVGIVLHPGRKIFCIDIDKCLVDGQWSELAQKLCVQFEGAYQEVSAGRHGVHIIASYTGEMAPHRCKNTALNVEFYTEARFIGISELSAQGSVLFDATHLLPALVADYFKPEEGGTADDWTTEPVWDVPGGDDDKKLIVKAKRAKSPKAIFGGAASFIDLWNAEADVLAKQWPGNHNGYDASSADLALANHLMWWTGGNCDRTAKLMAQSALHRDKHEREDYMQRTVLKAFAAVAKNPPKSKVKDISVMPADPEPTEADPRPVIKLTGGEFDRYGKVAVQRLADTAYTRGGHSLVHIVQARDLAGGVRFADDKGQEFIKGADGIARPLAQSVIVPATSAWIRGALMGGFQFWKFDKRSVEWERRDCPKDLADYIANQKTWPAIPPLTAISPTPILRPDLSVFTMPGYDPVTGIFYSPNLLFPAILATPTKDDALAALHRLWEPIKEFPFATAEAGATALAHIITAVLRASIDKSPLFFYTAPDPAAGKTKLAEIPSLIANGVAPALSPFSKGEELKKVLFSVLLGGDSSIIFDNVPNGTAMDAPELARFATSVNYSDRVLGGSDMRAVPNHCTVSATGNNITPVGDVARRSLVGRLEPAGGKARGRTFTIKDLTRFIVERRAQYIVDALTIVRAYAFAGSPYVAHPLESFEMWSARVRDPLIWLGAADPVATQVTETDEEVSTVGDAFAAIVTAVGIGQPFDAVKLAGLVMPMPGHSGRAGLREALVLAGCKEPTEIAGLRYWLRTHRGKSGGGYTLARCDGPKDAASVWVMRIRG